MPKGRFIATIVYPLILTLSFCFVPTVHAQGDPLDGMTYQVLAESERMKRAGRTREAIELLEKMKGKLESVKRDMTPQYAQILMALADVHASTREDAKAVELMGKAKKLLEKAPDKGLYLQCLYVSAKVRAQINDHANALKDYETYLKQVPTIDPEEWSLLAAGHADVGDVYQAMGDYRQAELSYQTAIENAEKCLKARGRYKAPYWAVYKSVSDYYVFVGDAEKAMEYAVKYGETVQKILGKRSPEYLGSVIGLGLALRNGRKYGDAEAVYKAGLQLVAQVHGNNPSYRATLFHMLGAVYSAVGMFKEAYDLDVAAVKLTPPNSPSYVSLLNNLAFSKLRLKKYKEADADFSVVLERSKAVFGAQHPYTGNSMFSAAVAKAYIGDKANALKLAKEAFDLYATNTQMALATGSEKSKLAFLRKVVGKRNAALSLHFQTYSDDRAAAELGFRSCMTFKGRVADCLSYKSLFKGTKLSDDNRAKLKALNKKKEALSELLWGRNAKGASSEKQHADADRLKAEIAEAEAVLFRNLPNLGTSLKVPSRLQISKAIPPGSVLLEFIEYVPLDLSVPKCNEHLAPRRYGVYVLDGKGVFSWADLGPAEALEKAVLEMWVHMFKGEQEKYLESGKAVYTKVLKPVADRVGKATHLIVAPDGMLHLIPFAALVDPAGKYLIQSKTVSDVGSGRDLIAYGKKRRSSSTKRTIRVFANPAYSAKVKDKAPKKGAGKAAKVPETFTPLPGTLDEAKRIYKIFPKTRFFVGANATEYNFKNVRKDGVLHVATHGFYMPETPQTYLVQLPDGKIYKVTVPPDPMYGNPLTRSGLGFAGANHKNGGKGEDGVLTALEVTTLNLAGVDMVVLSACETAQGDFKSGEGIYGLKRSFFLSGAASQMVTLWPVADKSTALFMEAFYKSLKAGADRATALQKAQLSLIESKEYASPLFWAPFVLSGDWSTLPGLQ